MGRSYKEINDFLRKAQEAIEKGEMSGSDLPPQGSTFSTGTFFWQGGFGPTPPQTRVSAGPEVTIIRTGSGRKRDAEFPEGGDPRFRAVLAEMLRIHISKSNDYGTGADIYANYRSAEAIGVPAWKSCFIRALEKVQRLTNAFSGKQLNHESVSDSFIDLANHIVISKVLYDEIQNSTGQCCEGGRCLCKG